MSKLVIVGLDAGSFNIIDAMTGEELPFLKGLIKNGVRAGLKSIYPAITPPAWTSLYTGVNPGKHGIFSFIEDTNTLVNSTINKYPYFWDLLDKKMILVNLPVTYPPRPPKNGILITGYPTPSGTEYTYPHKVQQEIETLGYIPESQTSSDISWMMQAAENKVTVFSHLLGRYDWEIAFLGIQQTDWVGHCCKWKDVKRLYTHIDRCILNAFDGKNYTYLFVSDHGLQEISFVFYLNEWLRSEGFLDYDLAIDKEINQSLNNSIVSRLLMRYSISDFNGSAVPKSLDMECIKHLLPQSLKSFLIRNFLPKAKRIVNWGHTKAYPYSTSAWYININLKGREKYGIVNKEDYETIREGLIQKLRTLKNPYTRKNIFKEVLRKEEVFHGENTDSAPDIIYVPADEVGMRITCRGDGVCIKPKKTASHSLCGIFIACGEDIKRGVELDSLKILDVAPTVIHMMGGKVPRYMDGRVRLEIFEEGSDPYKRAVQYEERSIGVPESRFQYTEEETKEIEKSLKDLGYL